jgi:hypothetical protein
MPAVPTGAFKRGAGGEMARAPTLGACRDGSGIEPAAGGENTRPAPGGANEPTAGAATGGAGGACGTTAGAATGGGGAGGAIAGAAAPTPTLPVCATTLCGMAASTSTVVKINNPTRGMRSLALLARFQRKDKPGAAVCTSNPHHIGATAARRKTHAHRRSRRPSKSTGERQDSAAGALDLSSIADPVASVPRGPVRMMNRGWPPTTPL